jgi:hypothetical protein
MGVRLRETEFELSRTLPDREAMNRHATEVKVELARPGLYGEREGSLLAEL